MILIKGITVTNSPEMREAKKKIKELEIGLANALEVNESHQKLNGRLQEQLTEVEEDNKKQKQISSWLFLRWIVVEIMISIRIIVFVIMIIEFFYNMKQKT